MVIAALLSVSQQAPSPPRLESAHFARLASSLLPSFLISPFIPPPPRRLSSTDDASPKTVALSQMPTSSLLRPSLSSSFSGDATCDRERTDDVDGRTDERTIDPRTLLSLSPPSLRVQLGSKISSSYISTFSYNYPTKPKYRIR